MQIQINVPEELDKKIELYKAYYGIVTKADTVVKMLEELKFDFKVKE